MSGGRKRRKLHLPGGGGDVELALCGSLVSGRVRTTHRVGDVTCPRCLAAELFKAERRLRAVKVQASLVGISARAKGDAT